MTTPWVGCSSENIAMLFVVITSLCFFVGKPLFMWAGRTVSFISPRIFSCFKSRVVGFCCHSDVGQMMANVYATILRQGSFTVPNYTSTIRLSVKRS